MNFSASVELIPAYPGRVWMQVLPNEKLALHIGGDVIKICDDEWIQFMGDVSRARRAVDETNRKWSDDET
jgi:hypothetical protein